MRISLCLMTWNELEGCKLDVPKLPRGAFDEVYAVDGGSTDGTVEYLTAQGIPVHRQPKKGLNAAYVHADEVSTCDAVVVLSHLGYRQDLALAASVPGIDLILGAHTHTLLHEPEKIGSTWICQGGSHARFYGYYEFIPGIGLTGGLRAWS